MQADIVAEPGTPPVAVTRPVALRAARYAGGVAALAGMYYGAAQVGYALEFAGPVAAIVWLPAGVGISVLYLAGVRYWPGVLLGDLLANDYMALPFGSAIGQTTGNMLEVVGAAVLIHRLVPRGSPLDTVGGLGRMVAAIVLATLVSATVGTLSLLAGGVVSGGDVLTVWRTWWLGDASGALVVVPFVIAWHRPPPPGWLRGRALEAVLALAAVIALGEVALRSHEPLTYLVFPPLIWAALRFDRRGATLAIAIAVGLAVWNTTHYFGPFSFESITRSVLNTQLFIAVAVLSTLALAAVVAEREAFAAGLRASRARLVATADSERRRLEHDLHDGAQQRLTALAFRLRESGERARDAPKDAPGLFRQAEDELTLAIDELRELAHGISPITLAGGGLAAAITAVATRSPVPVRLGVLPPMRLDPTIEATAFFVVAESVTNAQRYASPTSISVSAQLAGGALVVDVSDDGAGGAAERPGSGLQGLRDRVEAIGGTFVVSSRPRHGTRVVAIMPLARFMRSG
jgi:signal transduction histidine kinase